MFKGADKTFLLPVLLALAGVALMFYATRGGAGVSPDSTVYVGAARNLLAGRGLVVPDGRAFTLAPLTHYPPLYPALLALVGLAGIDPLAGARLWGVLLFGLNVFCAGAAVRAYAPRSRWAPALASFLTLSAPDVLQVHSMAWTEPFFILTSLVSLLALAAYLERGHARLLLAATSTAALALLSRYVGVVTAATLGAGLLLFGAKNFPRRLLDATLAAGLACLPLALWVLRNLSLAGDATDRRFAFHPPGLHHLSSALSTASTWLLFGRLRPGLRVAFFVMEAAALVALGVYAWRRAKRQGVAAGAGAVDAADARGAESEAESEGQGALGPAPLPRLPYLLGIFVALYLAFLIFTVSFVDADTVFDDRSLVPVHAALVVLGLCAACRLLPRAAARESRRVPTQGRAHNSKPGGLRVASVVLGVALAASYLVRGVGWVVRQEGDAQGYAGRAWRTSEVIEGVRRLPPDAPVYTNGYDAVYFLTGRVARSIPARVDRGTGRPNENYEAELRAMRAELDARRGALVYFSNLGERVYLPTEDELREALRLRPALRAADGAIYVTARDAPP